MPSTRRRHAAVALRAAATVAALLVVPVASARAQLGGIMKRARTVIVDKTAEKGVDKVAGRAGGAPGGSATIDDALVQKILAYDAAYVEEYDHLLATDPRFRPYVAARTAYERCYKRDVGYQKAILRYTRLSEQARLDGNMNASTKWNDSLSTARMAQLEAAPPGGCVIPALASDLADAATAGAAKGAEKKTGTSGGALAGLSERVIAYLHLSPAERQKAVAAGAYRAEELAAMDRSRAGLQAWVTHSNGGAIGVGADEQAVAKYQEEMERYRAERESYDRCTKTAQNAGASPAMPASIQAQMANVKEPTPAQQKEIERLSKLGEAAGNRGDAVKAKLYADSIQAVLGIRMSPQATADGQAYARQVFASQEQSNAALKKCGVAPDEPIKPAYVR